VTPASLSLSLCSHAQHTSYHGRRRRIPAQLKSTLTPQVYAVSEAAVAPKDELRRVYEEASGVPNKSGAQFPPPAVSLTLKEHVQAAALAAGNLSVVSGRPTPTAAWVSNTHPRNSNLYLLAAAAEAQFGSATETDAQFAARTTAGIAKRFKPGHVPHKKKYPPNCTCFECRPPNCVCFECGKKGQYLNFHRCNDFDVTKKRRKFKKVGFRAQSGDLTALAGESSEAASGGSRWPESIQETRG